MSMWMDWLKIIQLKPRFLFGIWFFGALLLGLPQGLAEIFSLSEIRNSFRPWLGLLTLLSFSFWLVQLIPTGSSYLARRRLRKTLIRYLEFLSPEEWILLAYCLKNNQQTITLSIVDRVAGSLVARGILERAAGVGNQMSWPYTIHNIVWDYLLLKRAEFMSKAPWSQQDIESSWHDLDHHIRRYD